MLDLSLPSDFVAFAPGEPNGGINGQNAVAVDLRGHQGVYGGLRNGEWNDDNRGQLLYPVCQTNIPQSDSTHARMWGTGQTSSFTLRICIDSDDYLFFQDDRMWLQYGGNWAAAGAHGACPEDYQGKAYINDEVWDISEMGGCHAGSTCPVSPTFTDERFMVPMGCSAITAQVRHCLCLAFPLPSVAKTVPFPAVPRSSRTRCRPTRTTRPASRPPAAAPPPPPPQALATAGAASCCFPTRTRARR